MPLHKDEPDRSVTLPDGREVKNLTAEEYDATYAEGEPHTIPDDVMADALAKAREMHPDES